MKKTLEPFVSTNNAEILSYINGNKNANLTDEQKKLLDTPKTQEVVKKHIEQLRSNEMEKARNS